MSAELENIVSERLHDAEHVSALRRHIYDAVLDKSKHLDDGNFSVFHPDDLRGLFDQYDDHFFQKELSKAVGSVPLTFRISKRMTSAAGKLSTYRKRNAESQWVRFEISISAPLLFQTFADLERTVIVNGVSCNDRLEAMQLVMEHEVTHLVETLLWDNTSCRQRRFQSIAERLFGHTEHTHQLITQRERACAQYQIHTGDTVAFVFEGTRYVGVVNRITKRVTVLVPDDNGEPYTDGKRYLKFYIPLGMLERVESGDK